MRFFSIVYFLFLFLSTLSLYCEGVKCQKCGYINSKDDRYCLECFTELRNLTLKEQTEQNNEMKEKALKSFEVAESYFKKANLVNEGSKSVTFYEIALRNAVNAIAYGNKSLSTIEIERLNEIKLICEGKLKNLRYKYRLTEKRVPMHKQGNGFYVDVLLNNEIKAKLHLDTGCDGVLISPHIAKKLNLKGGRDVYSIVADGRKVKGKSVTLNSVNVGGNVIEKINATVFDTSGDGLLGMTYLKHFKFEIDSKNNELILDPIK